MAALQLLSLLLLMTSPALADPGPGRSADGRRHAAPLPQGRFPAERLVPPNFRGPNVLEKLAAGTQGEGEGVHAENLAWIFEHVGHAMKAQDTNTRRLREEDGGAGDGGAGDAAAARRRLEGERKAIPASDTPDGYCGSHGWALQDKPDTDEFKHVSLPCGVGGKAYDKDSGEPYGCASRYAYLTTFEEATTTQDGLTYDYFIAWGWSHPTGGATELSPYLAACVYVRYEKGLKVNRDTNKKVEKENIVVTGSGNTDADPPEGISCKECFVDMGVDAKMAFFVEINTDTDPSTEADDLYTDFEVWTDVAADFDYNLELTIKNPKVALPERWSDPTPIHGSEITITLYPGVKLIINPSFELAVKGKFGLDGEATLTSSMDTNAGAWARYLQSEKEMFYGLVGDFEAKGPKLVSKDFTAAPGNNLFAKFKPIVKTRLEVGVENQATLEEYAGRQLKTGVKLETGYPVEMAFKEEGTGTECGTTFSFDSLVDLGVYAFPETTRRRRLNDDPTPGVCATSWTTDACGASARCGCPEESCDGDEKGPSCCNEGSTDCNEWHYCKDDTEKAECSGDPAPAPAPAPVSEVDDIKMLWPEKPVDYSLGLMDPWQADWCLSNGGGDASGIIVGSKGGAAPGGGGGGDDDDEGLDAAGTAGIVVGAIAFALLAGFGLVYYRYRQDEKAVEMGFAAWARSFVAAAPADAPQLAVEAEEDPKPAKTGWFSKSEPKKAAPADRAAALGADALAEAEIYWQDLEGTARGPCSWAEYKAAIFDGDVGPESLVRAPGVLDAFTRVGDVPALAALVPTRAQAAPPVDPAPARDPPTKDAGEGVPAEGTKPKKKSLLSKMKKVMAPKSKPTPQGPPPPPLPKRSKKKAPQNLDVALQDLAEAEIYWTDASGADMGPSAWAEYKAALFDKDAHLDGRVRAPGVLDEWARAGDVPVIAALIAGSP